MEINYLEWILKSALIVLAGTVLLRIAGRKSISQMTLAQYHDWNRILTDSAISR
jgi:uncharacterized membrane protein YcaP (DUF421 family)